MRCVDANDKKARARADYARDQLARSLAAFVWSDDGGRVTSAHASGQQRASPSKQRVRARISIAVALVVFIVASASARAAAAVAAAIAAATAAVDLAAASPVRTSTYSIVQPAHGLSEQACALARASEA